MKYEIRVFTVVLENAYDDEDQTASIEYGPRRIAADSREDAKAELYRLVGEERRSEGHTGEYEVLVDLNDIVPAEDANQTKDA